MGCLNQLQGIGWVLTHKKWAEWCEKGTLLGPKSIPICMVVLNSQFFFSPDNPLAP